MSFRARSPSVAATPDRRAVWLAAIAIALGLPAALVVAFCPGDLCRRSEEPESRVPFCSLPSDLRTSLVAGYREGRSPEVFVVAGGQQVRGSSFLPEGSGPAWPSLSQSSPRLPVGFWGQGIAPGTRLEEVRLDSIAPTLAAIASLDRPHPEVRSGKAPEGFSSGSPPRLLVLIVWKDVSTDHLETSAQQWPWLQDALDSGAATLDASPGSQPLDPAALLATIGTGGRPHQHGITGAGLRDDSGAIVKALGDRSPDTVIAALGDDLDEMTEQTARVGVVGTAGYDRGVIGGDWYVGHDRDDVRILDPRTGPGAHALAADEIYAGGYGSDPVPDLVGIVFEGDDIPALDRATARTARAAQRAADGSVAFAFAGTGSGAAQDAIDASELTGSVEAELGAPVIEAEAVGGFFLDQDVLVEAGVSKDDVVRVIRRDPRLRGGDVFSSTAIQLARYC